MKLQGSKTTRSGLFGNVKCQGSFWQWSIRRHPGKGLRWIKDKYFKTIENRHWVFSGLFQDNIPVYLEKMSDISIKRHVKIKAIANPFDASWKEYFFTRSNREDMAPSYEESFVT